MKDNLGALDVIPKLTPEVMAEIDEVRLCTILVARFVHYCNWLFQEVEHPTEVNLRVHVNHRSWLKPNHLGHRSFAQNGRRSTRGGWRECECEWRSITLTLLREVLLGNRSYCTNAG